jgi:hypothetical protein
VAALPGVRIGGDCASVGEVLQQHSRLRVRAMVM